ncbi:MAG: hypothetical protein Q8M23_09780, partial [Bacteroidales bacterium]|nr:hypothetical protein [Bacteroidales bacterium]
QFNDIFFATDGHVVLANFLAVRQFTHTLNQSRHSEMQVFPGEVNAAGLLDEIYHLVLREYEKKKNPLAFKKAFSETSKKVGATKLNQLLVDFVETFPPKDVYTGVLSASEYLKGISEGRSNASVTLEEAMMLFLANYNPANNKLKELFDENYLAELRSFRKLNDVLDDFFKTQPTFGPDNQDIFTLLKTPLLTAPGDLYA